MGKIIQPMPLITDDELKSASLMDLVAWRRCVDYLLQFINLHKRHFEAGFGLEAQSIVEQWQDLRDRIDKEIKDELGYEIQ